MMTTMDSRSLKMNTQIEKDKIAAKILKKLYSRGSRKCKCGNTISMTKIQCLGCHVRTTRPDLNVQR